MSPTRPCRLQVEGSSAHAGGGSNRSNEGREGRYDDLHYDFDNVFSFVVHGFVGFKGS